jgi:hypothetical protein
MGAKEDIVESPPSDALASSPAGLGARIAMTDDAVLALLRMHFTGVGSMYLCPSIPGKKELAARAVHARHLPSDERVLALFDDTVFGSGDDGFLVTSQRVCWKNVAERPHMIEWKDIDPDGMYADRAKLVLGTGAIELSGDESVIEACEEAFHVFAFSARAASPSGIVLKHDVKHQAHADLRESSRPTYRPSHPPIMLQSGAAPKSDRKPPIGNENANENANAAETRPPPHAVTYASYVVHASSQRAPAFACWECHTPLHWNTPQCARCSALPTAQGWQRTA